MNEAPAPEIWAATAWLLPGAPLPGVPSALAGLPPSPQAASDSAAARDRTRRRVGGRIMGRNLYPCRLPGGCAHEMMFALHLYDSRRTAGQQAEKTKRGQGPRSGARSR